MTTGNLTSLIDAGEFDDICAVNQPFNRRGFAPSEAISFSLGHGIDLK